MPNNTTDKRKFTKFVNHQINQKIQADHINIIQDSINDNQKHILDLQNERFINKVKFEFSNNRYTNTVCYDQFVSLSNIDTSKSVNINYNTFLNTMEINDVSKHGFLYTTMIRSTVNPDGILNDIFILDDVTLPAQSQIKYFIVNNNNEEYPIEPNDKLPFKLNNLKGFIIKIELIPNEQKESPILNGIATVFYDELIKYGLDDFNAYLQDSDNTTIYGDTILIRNPENKDKLEKVLEPDRIYYLKYDDTTEKLSTVTMVKNDLSLSIKETLRYGPYTNSEGHTEDVLLSVHTEDNTKNIGDEYESRRN